jgi:hypothetical protein
MYDTVIITSEMILIIFCAKFFPSIFEKNDRSYALKTTFEGFVPKSKLGLYEDNSHIVSNCRPIYVITAPGR